jgi:hypothetical protein
MPIYICTYSLDIGLHTWGRNRSASGLTTWLLYDNDDDDIGGSGDSDEIMFTAVANHFGCIKRLLSNETSVKTWRLRDLFSRVNLQELLYLNIDLY